MVKETVVGALLGTLYLATIPAPGFLAGLAVGRIAASTTAYHTLRTPSVRETGAMAAACLMVSCFSEAIVWRYTDVEMLDLAFPRLKDGPTRKQLLRAISMGSLVFMWAAAGCGGYRVAMNRWAPK